VTASRDLRWGLLLPAVVAVGVILWVTTGVVYTHVEKAFCAPENYSEGMCYGFEADAALQVVVDVAMAVSALVLGCIAVAIAPSNKQRVALITFAIGSGMAVAYGATIGEPRNAASAIGAGVLGLFGILWWLDRPRP
jgi:Ca2+/Na+ antiporter